MTNITPPAIALMGVSGSGKTWSIPTFIEAGVEVFFLGTEPGAVETLIDSAKKRNLDLSKLHYRQMKLAAPGWEAIFNNIDKVQKMSYESLSTLKDISKDKMDHFMELAKACKNFKCEHCGKDFGDVTMWKDDRAFVLDSLSGINKMAREYVVGYKPTMHQGEWGTAMQLEENLIYKLISDRSCFFVLIAHVDKEVDELLGGMKLTLAALGRKLAPQLIKYFSEVVYAKRVNEKFFWSTKEVLVDVKNRSLPIADDIVPSFVSIVNAHRSRLVSTTGAAPLEKNST